MPLFTGGLRHEDATRSYDAIMRVRLRPGTAAIVAVGLLGMVGTLCAALMWQADAMPAPRAAGSDAAIAAPQGRARETMAAEEELHERISALRTLEKQLRTATAGQIIGLYKQLHKHLLEPFGLTDIESEIALATISGASNADIAAHMHLSESTVKHRLTAVFKKTHTANRYELRSKMLEQLKLAVEDGEGPRA